MPFFAWISLTSQLVVWLIFAIFLSLTISDYHSLMKNHTFKFNHRDLRVLSKTLEYPSLGRLFHTIARLTIVGSQWGWRKSLAEAEAETDTRLIQTLDSRDTGCRWNIPGTPTSADASADARKQSQMEWIALVVHTVYLVSRCVCVERLSVCCVSEHIHSLSGICNRNHNQYQMKIIRPLRCVSCWHVRLSVHLCAFV